MIIKIRGPLKIYKMKNSSLLIFFYCLRISKIRLTCLLEEIIFLKLKLGLQESQI